jgi:hypothetical protein
MNIDKKCETIHMFMSFVHCIDYKFKNTNTKKISVVVETHQGTFFYIVILTANNIIIVNNRHSNLYPKPISNVLYLYIRFFCRSTCRLYYIYYSSFIVCNKKSKKKKSYLFYVLTIRFQRFHSSLSYIACVNLSILFTMRNTL